MTQNVIDAVMTSAMLCCLKYLHYKNLDYAAEYPNEFPVPGPGIQNNGARQRENHFSPPALKTCSFSR